MSKYYKASDEVQKLVDEIGAELGLTTMGVDFEAVGVVKSKEVVSVSKASAVAEYFSNREDLVLVFVYEDVFDMVDEKTKYLWLRMAMEQVSMNDETGKVVIGCPTITVPIAVYDKFKGVAIDAALLQYYSLKQLQDKKKEEKERQKQNKKNKGNQ